MNIMNEHFCNYQGKRDETLVAYLYGELAAAERATFERHVSACAPCRTELEALGALRTELGDWTAPELVEHVMPELQARGIPELQARGVLEPRARPRSVGASLREIPWWAQTAAAMLFLGAAAGLANIEVDSTADGVSIRTGWRHEAPEAGLPVAASVAATTDPSAPAPWQKDLTALEQQLRGAINARPAPVAMPAAGNDATVLRQVRALLQDSERRQQSELALRVAQAERDIQAQRQADLVKIDRTLGLIQSRTGMEVMRTQRQMNSLAQQVSQRP